MGNRDKNATATGASDAPNTESKIKSTANTGRERSAETIGAKKRANEGTRYAITEKINANTKEIANADKARSTLMPKPTQKTPDANNALIFIMESKRDGTNSSFAVAKYKYAHTMTKNTIATSVCNSVCRIIFFTVLFLILYNSNKNFARALQPIYR